MEGARKPSYEGTADFINEDLADFSNTDGINEENSADYGQSFEKLTVKHKINTFLIILVGIFGLFLGTFQLANNISNPLAGLLNPANNPAQAQDQCANGNCQSSDQSAAITALKSKDTDGDGLSDYDELYVYGTSPYLTDSDSDGINDREELTRGTDPNCATGMNCFYSGGNLSTSSQSVPTNQALPNITAPQITPAYIRQLLVENGASVADVNSMTDAEVVQMFQEALADNPDIAQQMTAAGVTIVPAAAGSAAVNNTPANQVSAPIATATAASSTPAVDTSKITINSLDDLKNLSGAQIRALLIKQGADATLLGQVTDDELKALFVQKLEEKASTTASSANQ